MQTYARPELVFTRGEGARLYDAHGKEYLDFAAGIAVNALGAFPAPVRCIFLLEHLDLCKKVLAHSTTWLRIRIEP